MWKPAVAENVLLELASSWAGEAITEIEPLAEGEDSRAVAFSSRRAGPVVLRLRRDGTGFPREIHARELLAPVGVVVPRVFATGEVADLAWCISERVKGINVQQLSKEEALAIAPALLDTWRAIASVRRPIAGSGIGRFDDRPAPTWAAFLDSQDAEVEASRDQLTDVVGGHLLDKAMRVLGQRPAAMDEARLVHFDFGSNNVMVADGRVTAVLDWDYPGWGDPLWDVANLHAWRERLTCMDIHAGYFDAELAALPYYRERVRFYGTHIALGAIRWELFVGGEADVSEALQRGLRRLVG